MAEIIPFRALRYNPQVVSDLKLVVTPPYDVISPEAQERYHARHPHNVVRLILAKDAGGEAPDRYERAARTFAAWQAEGILTRDPEPGIYVAEQEFSVGEGHRIRRRGLLAMMRLAAYEEKIVFPHERTFAKYREDRLRLMRACPANLEPIFGFYPGPDGSVCTVLDRSMEAVPQVDFVDEDGTRQRLWILPEPAAVAALTQAFRDRPVIIADGHHRYETALNFRQERRARDAAPPDVQRRRPDDFVLMYLVSAQDPGLLILPTHRVIRQRPLLARDALRRALERYFRIEVCLLDPGNPVMSLRIALADIHRRRQNAVAFGLYAGDGELLVLELGDQTAVHDLIAAGHSPEYARLDVAILHGVVIERVLGIQATGQADDTIQYTRDEGQALQAVAAGDAHLALFQNPPRVEQVQAVALAGERMPQKSTFFYPKVLSGLVINPLDPAELVSTSR
ncbi:MAG: DUF1015 domain-containing protein [candidate division NC10 bacterium]|nr:DUF1015 domain-containing protein [candidate division NC10 bacterium]